jgi:hypothetical protein
VILGAFLTNSERFEIGRTHCGFFSRLAEVKLCECEVTAPPPRLGFHVKVYVSSPDLHHRAAQNWNPSVWVDSYLNIRRRSFILISFLILFPAFFSFLVSLIISLSSPYFRPYFYLLFSSVISFLCFPPPPSNYFFLLPLTRFLLSLLPPPPPCT